MATYAVVFELQRRVSVRVGSLGTFCLQPGCYVYVGQARRGVQQRITRHFRREKRLRWHADYLPKQPEAKQFHAQLRKRGATGGSLLVRRSA